MSLIQDQTQIYVNLLLAEYSNSPRAQATIAIYAKQALADMLASQMDAAFTLGTAVGPQLDILAKYIGLKRTIGLPVPQPYFTFSDYAGPQLSTMGFLDYTNPALNSGIIWYDYLFNGTQNTALSDAALNFMLKMQIVLNSNDGTLSSIMSFLQLFFGNQIVLVDNKNMTLTYALGSQIPAPPAVLLPYLPKPMGVGVNFLNLSSVTIPSTISATTASKLRPVVVTSALVTAAPTSGTPPYTYQWTWVSGSTGLLFSPLITATAPNSATTAFTYSRGTFPATPATVNAIFQVTAIDAQGIPFISNQIAVTLTANFI
jgi:hypothetical protein